MYKIEQNVVFLNEAVIVMALFIRLTLGLGTYCRTLSQHPEGLSKIQAPGKTIHSNKRPREERGRQTRPPQKQTTSEIQKSIDQNILERHQKRAAFELSD